MTRNFIIVEPDPIVLMDVEGLLSSHFSKADISVCTSLDNIGSVNFAFSSGATFLVRATLIEQSSALRNVVQEAARHGTKILTIGEATGLGIAASAIDLPFTSEMVLTAINSDTQEPEIGEPA